MTTEEKAKRYDEAIERAKKVLLDCTPEEQNVVEYIFHELAESEDEKIRKEIIRIVDIWTNSSPVVNGIPRENLLAWLEKQKTSKEAMKYLNENHSPSKVSDFQAAMNVAVAKAYDKGFSDGRNQDERKNFAPKVELKFKDGDWLVENEPNNYARFIQILEVVNVYGKERYKISRDIHNDEDVVECRFIENNYHFFTIQDAKSGDILATKEGKRPFIFKGLLDKFHPECPVAYCGIDTEYGFVISSGDGWWTDEEVEPSTKEQRDLLFKKMEEAGYRWSSKDRKIIEI